MALYLLNVIPLQTIERTYAPINFSNILLELTCAFPFELRGNQDFILVMNETEIRLVHNQTEIRLFTSKNPKKIGSTISCI